MKVAVIIPCYRVVNEIDAVLAGIGPEVDAIYCVDDACPDRSGAHIEATSADERIKVLYHKVNGGVGSAVMTGYAAAAADDADIMVKVDGDGQMSPALIPRFIAPIAAGTADYTKGNRFFNPGTLGDMPKVRLFGNTAMSFFSKLSSGYWHLFDPANGYTAIHASVYRQLQADRIARRYFFESDMLFHLGGLRAVVQDVPMQAVYADETSSLKPAREALPFMARHLANLVRRIGLNYFVRDFNIGSVYLVASLILIPFGILFGAGHWIEGEVTDTPATAGTVMLAALPLYIGVNTLLGFFNYDTSNVPRIPIAGALEEL